MTILAIETSCDETAVAIITRESDVQDHSFSILGNALLSQAEKHMKYGGVYPSLAKREHAKNLIPLTKRSLLEAQMLIKNKASLDRETKKKLQVLLEREPELYRGLTNIFETYAKPNIERIAVTVGPGLEPALWVGINFAKALSLVWNIPLIPVNHMEGHIFASIIDEKMRLKNIAFPALALLISGGHTELVLMKDWFDYTKVGTTRDDAVGEAFDKVARMLGLTYPGGPEISRIAQYARAENRRSAHSFPRPMIGSGDCDFSFSGLKTSVLYTLRNIDSITEQMKQEFAREFEDAVVEVLISKTRKAVEMHGVRSLILGGGVSANTEIRKAFKKVVKQDFPDISLYIPTLELSTDNAIMIAVAGSMRTDHSLAGYGELVAEGNLSLEAT